MLGRFVLVALTVLASTSQSWAKDSQDQRRSGESPAIQRWPAGEARPTPTTPPATAAAAPAPTGVAEPRSAAPLPRTASSASAAASADQRRRPSDRDREGGQPRVAVPREPGQAPRPRGDVDRRREGRPRVYVVPPRVGRVLPRRIYPYGYGAFGFSDPYFNSYGWSSRAPLYAYGPGVYGGGYYGYGYNYDIGEIRFRVTPRDAQVFVDGYYAGIVDDYDGVLQSLRLESGPYHIELVAPGYAPLEVDIRVNPGQKVTYRGDLSRRP